MKRHYLSRTIKGCLPSRWPNVESFQEVKLNSFSGRRDDDPDALGVRGRNVRVVWRAQVHVAHVGRQQDLASAAESSFSVPEKKEQVVRSKKLIILSSKESNRNVPDIVVFTKYVKYSFMK